MRVVAGNAIALGARMLDFCFFDLFRLIRVARHAERLRVRVGQDNFSILRWRMADFARLICERRMRELLQQLGLRGLMRIMALDAIGTRKRLITVCFL